MNYELPIPQTSPSLLLRIRDARDQESWLTFEEIYRPIIIAWCQMKGVSTADAEDIAQETMSCVARAIKAFDYTPERGRFRAWLGTITANELKSHMAKTYRKLTVAIPDNSLAAPPTDPDSDWIAIYANRIFRAACQRIQGQFEPTTWQCFESTWISRQPAGEVARALGVPVHSVYVNKSRVMKRLEAEVLLLAEELLPIVSDPIDSGTFDG